ncbi:MAG: glycosyltransferase family 4 protein [Sphingomicrobium sp.]
MRILYVSQWFEPEPNNSKTEAFLNGLVAEGAQLTVLTGFPNYPGGKLYPGYRIRPFQSETLMGFEVHRVPLYPSHSRSSIGRIANYLSFFLSSLTYGLINGRKFDLAYVYHPPITVGLSAALWGWLWRVPFVIEIQDLWPDSVAASDMAGAAALSRLLQLSCNFVHWRAARIVVQCPGMKQKLLERGVPDEKVVVVYNWTDEKAFAAPAEFSAPFLEEPGVFKLTYAGNFGRAQNCETMIRAVALASKRLPKLQLLMIGDGVEEQNLRALVTQLGATGIGFHPRVSRKTMAAIYPRADALVCTLTRQDLFAHVIPTKTQAYMAAGRPVLMSVNGDAARLITEAAAGIAVPPEDPEALADAIVRMAETPREQREAMGRAARAYYYEHLSFARGMAKTLDVIRDAIGNRYFEPPRTSPALTRQ